MINAGWYYTDYMRVKQDLLLKIADIIMRHGARLAVPVATVHMSEGPAPAALAGAQSR